MASTFTGIVNIQPLEANYSASQQVTTIVFLSNDSGSYINGGFSPILSSSLTQSLTFESSGSLYSFVFSGDGYVSPSGKLPGTTITASINGTTAESFAEAFSASVASNTDAIVSLTGSLINLYNPSFSSSISSYSDFNPLILNMYTSSIGMVEGTFESDTTGSLIVTGSAQITGSLDITGSFNNGMDNINIGNYSHAEGTNTTASGDYSHAEGAFTQAIGYSSHAEGALTQAIGTGSHAEGYNTTASGHISHTEGHNTYTVKIGSHAEGYNTTASEIGRAHV